MEWDFGFVKTVIGRQLLLLFLIFNFYNFVSSGKNI
jgi:hypothetical protein